MIASNDYLGRYMLEEQLITDDQLRAAEQLAKEQSVPLVEALVLSGATTERNAAIARASLCETVFVDLEHYEVDIRNAEHLPRTLAERYHAFPLFVFDNVVTVAMADPMNLDAIDRIRQALRAEVEPVLCEPNMLAGLIGRAYRLSQLGTDTTPDKQQIAEDASSDEPIVAAVNQIISDAISLDASDVHISPCERELQLRYRVDGRLRAQQAPPISAHAGIVQRLKVMSRLDLTQTRRPQDGKIRFKHPSGNFDLRLSTIPTVHGENVVMRILRPNTDILDFAQLGMDEPTRSVIEPMFTRPHGMILVTGPTGSGKTSTLFTGIKKLNTPDRNIMTIEDPVEIRLPGIRQIQANPEIGLTFANALRSILRQDPDIVLVGEIRDDETAQIATQASLTGHLVLSTLHTNDAAGAITRLRNLSVAPFVINAALIGVIAQRLVRRICSNCTQAHKPHEALLHRFGITNSGATFAMGKGCPSCSGCGFRGRVGLYEALAITPPIAQLIEEEASTQQIASTAQEHAMRPMWRDGLLKAQSAQTTLEEVAHVAAIADTPEDVELRMSA